MEFSNIKKKSHREKADTTSETSGCQPRKPNSLRSQLNSNLVYAVALVSFVTYFPVGHSITGMNSAENVVINWVRMVKCQRLGGTFGQNLTNHSPTSINSSSEHNDSLVWCRRIPEVEEENMLDQNPELNRIWAIMSSIILLGATVGSIFVNNVVKCVGIKWAILMSTLIFAAGSILCACSKLSQAYELLIVGRFILGVATGLMDVMVPVYITEISPAMIRGAADTIPSVTYRLGFVFGSSLAFPDVFGNEASWTSIMAAQVAPTVIACIGLPFCPESPRYLFIERSNTEAAERSLKWLRKSDDIAADVKELQKEKDSSKEHKGYIAFFRDPQLRKVFSYCALPAMSEGLCGNDAVLFYSTSIFIRLQLDQSTATAASTGVWCAALLATVFSALLVDRVGRRLLLSASYFGTLVTLVVFVICLSVAELGNTNATYGSMICLPANMFFFSLGAESIPTLLPTELFPEEARNTATSSSQMVLYGMGLIATLAFPIIITYAKHYTYLIFVGFTLFLMIFVLRKLPETRGKELETVQEELEKTM